MKALAICTVTVLLLQFYVGNSDSAKILGIFPTMSKSHYFVGESLMKALVDAGHEVTVISPFVQKKPIKNWREFDTKELAEGFDLNFLEVGTANIIQTFKSTLAFSNLITNFTLTHRNVQRLIKSNNETFDLIILEVFINEAMLGFSHLFKAPVVALSTFGPVKWVNDMVGSPAPLSYVPHPSLGLSDRMTFYERLTNAAYSTADHIYTELFYWPMQCQIYNEIFPDPKPELHVLQRNVSLVLLNTHVTLSTPKPYAPNMIEIGGIQIKRSPGKLPADLQTTLDDATNGVIYFSMGSNIKSKLLPIKLREEMLTIFAGLKETVLWKWEDPNLPGKPDNVHISKWFPQDEILAHPNVKLFITHGGLLGSTEAVYHGVPVLGFPVFGDQELNMARAVKSGYGISIPYLKLTGALMKDALDKMLSTDTYNKRAKLYSERYRDQPMTPIETAVYWIEYVLRHKGAPHLRSAGLDLSFVSYHSLDVFAFMLAIPIVVLYGLKLLVCRLVCRNSTKQNRKVKTN